VSISTYYGNQMSDPEHSQTESSSSQIFIIAATVKLKITRLCDREIHVARALFVIKDLADPLSRPQAGDLLPRLLVRSFQLEAILHQTEVSYQHHNFAGTFEFGFQRRIFDAVFDPALAVRLDLCCMSRARQGSSTQYRRYIG
jgi:hypothetical protein